MALELRILGPVEATDDGETVDLGTAKERALLALLALSAGRVVPIDRLAEDLWEGEPPPQAAATLRVYVSHLRKALAGGDGAGEIIKTRRPGYLLELPPDALDAARFETTCARARAAASAGDQTRAADLFREALALWRGPALADIADQSFARLEANRLEEGRLAALEERIAADLALGRHGELIGELDVLTAAYPLRERLWGHRMTALYGAGRQADALAVYRELRERLGDELGIDPSAELQELERKILTQDPTLAAFEARAAAPRVLRLPAYRTTFFGRTEEIAALERDLDTYQLVSLTGVGGCGKTRLAVEAAYRLADRFRDGVFFVDLGSVGDPDVVPHTVASSLGMTTGALTGASPRPILEEIFDALRDRAALILLDNCEHLLEASAEIAEAILGASAEVRVIASSREALAVEGERVVTIPSLGVPDEIHPVEADSFRLFVDRASAARTVFRLDDEGVAAVAEICRRLDGIPLAIELAAARVTHLSPKQIADRLTDRFRLLTGGRRRIQRQQTLQAAMDWSHDLLEVDERVVFRRLAVFPSDFSVEAAEDIAGAGVDKSTLDVLGSLVSKSLLTVTEDGGDVRYRLPETLRLYAEQRLADAGESDAMRDRHLAHYRSWIESLPSTIGAFNPWSYGLEREAPNVIEALKWADVTDAEALGHILARTRMQWWSLGRIPEGAALYERALAASDRLERRDLVSLLGQYASLLFFQGDHERGVEAARRAVEIGSDADAYPMVEALFIYGSLISASDRREAEAVVERAGRIAQGLEPTAGFSLAVQRAEMEMSWGEIATARDLYASAEHLSGEFYMGHWGRFGKVIALHILGEREKALQASETAMANARNFDDLIQGTFLTLWTYVARALALAGVGRFDEAREILADLFETVRRTFAPKMGVEAILTVHAAIAYLSGDPERASRLLARSRAGQRTLSGAAVYRHYSRLIRHALGPERARRCRAEGEAMSIDEALALAEAGI